MMSERYEDDGLFTSAKARRLFAYLYRFSLLRVQNLSVNSELLQHARLDLARLDLAQEHLLQSTVPSSIRIVSEPYT
jgi:hypothetical protein